MQTAKTLIRLGGCPGWSESSLGTQPFCWFCHVVAQISLASAASWDLPRIACGMVVITRSRLVICSGYSVFFHLLWPQNASIQTSYFLTSVSISLWLLVFDKCTFEGPLSTFYVNIFRLFWVVEIKQYKNNFSTVGVIICLWTNSLCILYFDKLHLDIV